MSSSSTFSSLATIFMFLFFLNLPFSNSLLPINATLRRASRQLSVNYYAKSCPQVESLVGSVTSNMFKEAPASGPATIRLFFHDCFVEGCDGSILISSKAGSKELAEKDAEDNKDIAKEAFEGINKAKAIVESKCPGVVSCADILAIATRNFVHLGKRRKRNPGRAILRHLTCLAGDEDRKMRAVVQRVASASVEVEGHIVSAIGPGLLVLVGLHESDVDSDADYICRKVLNMRLFPNEETGKTWDHSVVQKNYEVLLVSQFTLYGILKGNKPDFHVAMPPEKAKPFYASLVEKFQKAYKQDAVKDGVFGAKMKVNLVNDGPVTMHLDSAQPSK